MYGEKEKYQMSTTIPSEGRLFIRIKGIEGGGGGGFLSGRAIVFQCDNDEVASGGRVSISK